MTSVEPSHCSIAVYAPTLIMLDECDSSPAGPFGIRRAARERMYLDREPREEWQRHASLVRSVAFSASHTPQFARRAGMRHKRRSRPLAAGSPARTPSAAGSFAYISGVAVGRPEHFDMDEELHQLERCLPCVRRQRDLTRTADDLHQLQVHAVGIAEVDRPSTLVRAVRDVDRFGAERDSERPQTFDSLVQVLDEESEVCRAHLHG